MAKGFLSPKVGSLLSKLGAASAMVPTALAFLKVKLANGDAEGARKRVHELREYHQRGLKFCDDMDTRLADNVLDGNEIAATLGDLDEQADELQDVFTGDDEDDGTGPA